MRRAALLLLSALFVTALCTWALVRDLGNADLDSYAALAYGYAGQPIPDHWPKKDWSEYAGGDAGFETRLAFYRSRVLYTGLLAVGIRAGIEPDTGAAALNAVGILLLWLGGVLVARRVSLRFEEAATLSACALLVSHASEVLSRGTPDLLAAGLATAALGLAAARRSSLAWALAVLTVLNRPDSLPIVAACTLPLLFPAADSNRRGAIVQTLAGWGGLACLAIGISAWSDHPGWSALFTQTFVGFLSDLNGPFPVSPQDYWGQVLQGIKASVSLNGFTVSGFTLAFATALWSRQWRHPYLAVSVALLGAIAFRFLVFPWGYNRMFIGTEVVGVVLVVTALAYSGGTDTTREHK